MGDSAMAIVAIFLAAILMFIFPLMTVADEKDDVSTLTAQTATTEFTNEIRATGKLTQEDYDNFVLTLAATGNSYDVEMTVQVLDENPAKKETSGTVTIGNNVYYVMYTTQILEQLQDAGVITFKEGDIISVAINNTNVTVAQQLRNWVYSVTGNDESTITAKSSGFVTANGN